MLVAQNLLDRAELLQKASRQVLQDVQAGVLATDALELLGGRTPTLSAQALVLKHLCEVSAECHFGGVEYHFEVQSRFEELQVEARAVASWFDRSEQENARLNILMRCGNCLAGQLREQNQYDEEQFWMNKVRHWQNSLWMRAKPWRYVYWPFLRYGEILLASFQTFCLCIVAWIIGLTAALSLVNPTAGRPATGEASGSRAFGQAVSSFFGSGTFDSNNPAWIALTVVAVVAGFVHLGILVSHLYSIISRR